MTPNPTDLSLSPEAVQALADEMSRVLIDSWAETCRPGEWGTPSNVYFSVAKAVEVLAPAFAARLAQEAGTCETCAFAGSVDRRRRSLAAREFVDGRQCYLMAGAGVGHYGYQFVPLTLNGRPFRCDGYRAKETT